MHNLTNKQIHGDHPFRLQLAERHTNRPLVRARGAEAITGQISTFADAHAGVTNQQKSITAQIVTAQKLLLEELILLCRGRAWQPSGEARNVLAADQIYERTKLLGPSQFIEDAAQRDEQVDIGCCHQRRGLRVQVRHPAKDVWLTAQLVQGVHLRVFRAEVEQKIALAVGALPLLPGRFQLAVAFRVNLLTLARLSPSSCPRYFKNFSSGG